MIIDGRWTPVIVQDIDSTLGSPDLRRIK